MTEKWRPIKGFGDLYYVSNTGKIKRNKLCTEQYHNINNSYIVIHRKEKIIKPNIDRNGYEFVGLILGNKVFTKKVHRLVAEAFIPNPDNLPEVNHKSEEKWLNTVDNLEWCDRKYNVNYGTARKRTSETLKKTSPKKIKVVQKDKNNNIVKIWNSMREAERHGFTHGNISLAIKKNKCYLGYKWEVA